MGYSVVPQMLRLTRGEPQGKHRANGLMILKEMLEERASLSDTLEHFHILMNTKMEHLEVKHGTNFAKKQTLIKLQEKQKQVKIFSVLYRKNLQSLLL